MHHAMGIISRYLENPGKEHWHVVKWVLRYLKGTSDHGITFNGCNDYICGYID